MKCWSEDLIAQRSTLNFLCIFSDSTSGLPLPGPQIQGSGDEVDDGGIHCQVINSEQSGNFGCRAAAKQPRIQSNHRCAWTFDLIIADPEGSERGDAYGADRPTDSMSSGARRAGRYFRRDGKSAVQSGEESAGVDDEVTWPVVSFSRHMEMAPSHEHFHCSPSA